MVVAEQSVASTDYVVGVLGACRSAVSCPIRHQWHCSLPATSTQSCSQWSSEIHAQNCTRACSLRTFESLVLVSTSIKRNNFYLKITLQPLLLFCGIFKTLAPTALQEDTTRSIYIVFKTVFRQPSIKLRLSYVFQQYNFAYIYKKKNIFVIN